MKHPVLVGFVVVIHVVLIGGVLISFPGCTTAKGPSDGTEGNPYPPGDEIEQPKEVIGIEPGGIKKDPATGGLTTVTPNKPWAERFTLYTIRKGDTLSGIAKHYNVSSRDIIQLNELTDPNKLKVKQVIKLPGKIDMVDAPPALTNPVKPPKEKIKVPAGGTTYVVQKGDSLSVFANRHGIKTSELAAANGITNLNKIRVGQKLKVPGGKKPVKPEEPVGDPVPDKTDLPTPPVDTTTVTPPVNEATAELPKEKVEIAADGTEIITAADGRKFRIVEAEEGDDIFSIALRTKADIRTLKSINNLTGNSLTPGQRVKVPVLE